MFTYTNSSIDPLYKWRQNLNSNTLYILSLDIRQDFSHECVFREEGTSALAVPLPCPLVVVAPGSKATFRESLGNKEACFVVNVRKNGVSTTLRSNVK